MHMECTGDGRELSSAEAGADVIAEQCKFLSPGSRFSTPQPTECAMLFTVNSMLNVVSCMYFFMKRKLNSLDRPCPSVDIHARYLIFSDSCLG